MKRTLMTAAAACALTLGMVGCASGAANGWAAADEAALDTAEEIAANPPARASAETAAAFVADAEQRLAALSEEAARIQWTRATNITFDTMWLESKINAEYTELQVELANGAARFNDVEVPADVRRKLNLLRLGIVLPAPNRPGAAAELADITTRLDSTYATGKFEFKGRQITLDEASILMAESRDPAELKALYEGWRSVSPQMAPDYARMVEIANEGSRELGFADTGAMWRAGYDMEPDAFAAETDRLWEQVKPFYENLHCYVRSRLNAKYGDAVQPDSGPIRADLLGNMWSQQWGNIYDVVAPATGGESSYDLTELLREKDYDAERMVKTGEGFYTSLGMAPLPQTFWERSMITRPEDRDAVRHSAAWDLDNAGATRISVCTR
nr:M2 family metallopeptidase [Brevundimonas sp.]